MTLLNDSGRWRRFTLFALLSVGTRLADAQYGRAVDEQLEKPPATPGGVWRKDALPDRLTDIEPPVRNWRRQVSSPAVRGS